jgi:predicted neutral ceramidase superfamily lipid hydrolase
MIRAILMLTLAVYVIRPGEWLLPEGIRWNLILNVLGATALAGAAMSGSLKNVADRTWAFVGGFFAWMLLSTTFNLQFEKYSSYFTDMLTVIVVFYMTTAAIRTPKQARSLVYFFLGLTLFVCFQCYLQLSQGYNIAGVGASHALRWLRGYRHAAG